MRVLVPLRWADMDAFGHVNNVQYLRLLEIARIQSLGQIGEAVLGGIVVARHEIEYLAPMDFRLAPVAVDLWVTRVGCDGFDVGYHVQDPPGRRGAPVCRRRDDHGALRPGRGRPRR